MVSGGAPMSSSTAGGDSPVGEAPGQVTLSTTLTWALQLSQLPAR